MTDFNINLTPTANVGINVTASQTANVNVTPPPSFNVNIDTAKQGPAGNGSIPGLPFTSIQYNNNNSFAGNTRFTWDNGNAILNVVGNAVIGNIFANYYYPNGSPFIGGGGNAIANNLPYISFSIIANGNGQTFTSNLLSLYSNVEEIALFKNGSYVTKPNYTLVGNVLTFLSPLRVDDTLDIIRIGGGGSSGNGGSGGNGNYSNSNVAAYLPVYGGNILANTISGNGSLSLRSNGYSIVANAAGGGAIGLFSGNSQIFVNNDAPGAGIIAPTIALTPTMGGDIIFDLNVGNSDFLIDTITGSWQFNNDGNLYGIGANANIGGNVRANYFLGNISANISNVANTQLNRFQETLIDGGNVFGTITPDASLGSIYSYAYIGNITLNTIANAVPGTSMTIILRNGTGSPYTTNPLTCPWLFAGGIDTLSFNANSIDIINVFYSGAQYYATLTKGYS